MTMQRQRAPCRGCAPRHSRRCTSDDGKGASVKLDRAERKHPASFAHVMTRKFLHQEWMMDRDAAIGAEARAPALCIQAQDFHRAFAAFAAFAAKQTPRCEEN